jgi:phosphatidate cytidylyltransferase
MSVADADPAKQPRPLGRSGSELALRIASALVLAPLAIAAAYFGGWPFAIFWSLAAVIVFWEWTTLVAGGDRRALLMLGGAALVLALALAGSGRLTGMLVVIVMGAMGTAPLAPARRRAWVAGAVPYAGAIGIAPMVLRSDGEYGFVAVLFLFAIVWATDITAYFLGRMIGGPKLLPRVSPNKTWSGAVGGLTGAIIAAIAIAKGAGLAGWLALATIAALLSAFAQAGDLFESLLKRKFGAKNSSHLIPGHGGLMDRLDGFVVAAAVAALIGILRGGLEAPARGLLVW